MFVRGSAFEGQLAAASLVLMNGVLEGCPFAGQAALKGIPAADKSDSSGYVSCIF